METVRKRTFNTSVPVHHEVVMTGPCGVPVPCEPYAQDWLRLGSHWIASEETEVKATLKRVLEEGKSRMNSAHLLGKFDHFTDDDWDNALLIWWQCLAVFFFFGGAISAAVWA
jgi:hypothetical protein